MEQAEDKHALIIELGDTFAKLGHYDYALKFYFMLDQTTVHDNVSFHCALHFYVCVQFMHLLQNPHIWRKKNYCCGSNFVPKHHNIASYVVISLQQKKQIIIAPDMKLDGYKYLKAFVTPHFII